jgi:hypothetical protein
MKFNRSKRNWQKFLIFFLASALTLTNLNAVQIYRYFTLPISTDITDTTPEPKVPISNLSDFTDFNKNNSQSADSKCIHRISSYNDHKIRLIDELHNKQNNESQLFRKRKYFHPTKVKIQSARGMYAHIIKAKIWTYLYCY